MVKKITFWTMTWHWTFTVQRNFLQFSPQRSSVSQLKEFQTDIINHLFSNLIDAEPFMGEGGVLLTHGSHAHVTGKKGQSSSAAYDNLQQNVAYFTSRVVDRIWQGIYSRLVFFFFVWDGILIIIDAKLFYCMCMVYIDLGVCNTSIFKMPVYQYFVFLKIFISNLCWMPFLLSPAY